MAEEDMMGRVDDMEGVLQLLECDGVHSKEHFGSASAGMSGEQQTARIDRTCSLGEPDLAALLAPRSCDLHLLLARGGADELSEAPCLAPLLLDVDAADSPGSSVTGSCGASVADSSCCESEIDALIGSDDAVGDVELYALDGAKAASATDQHDPPKGPPRQASTAHRWAIGSSTSGEAHAAAKSKPKRKRTLSLRAAEAAEAEAAEAEAAEAQLPAKRPARHTAQHAARGEHDMATQASSAEGSAAGETLVRCPVPGCGRQFLGAWATEKHAKTHVADENRVFRCDQCDKSFFSMVVLKAHVRIHTRKPFSFACTQPGCAKRYCTSEGLRLHQRNRHEADKNWSCPSEGCPKAFVRQSDLRLHVLRMHAAVRPHPCSHAGCGKTFACFSELTRHEASHRYRPDRASREGCPSGALAE